MILGGGTAFGGTISAGALGIIESGGAVTSDGNGNPLFINSGGTFEFLGTGNAGAEHTAFLRRHARAGFRGVLRSYRQRLQCRHHREWF